MQTRAGSWFSSLPLGTKSVLVTCCGIYAACVLGGYDAFGQVCMAPRWVLYNGGGFGGAGGGWRGEGLGALNLSTLTTPPPTYILVPSTKLATVSARCFVYPTRTRPQFSKPRARGAHTWVRII
jgi:hypothetical protein